ncbi:exonuclease domain-containing protein [Alteromonas lipotrueiana]|uniref:exonuclease domain-containing protein n=1 Tax=Alteromonas lipotrueiana TaxID=2803815 RepID=UPI001C47CEB9|nr:exonuclease domain-containing protein [Alteromonas lipotrueiana]
MRKELPERYYLDHFHEFLSFFDAQSQELLDPETQRFIDSFRALSMSQQCIIARAANRKYAIINRTQFSYAEIAHAQQQLDALVSQGWFGPVTHVAIQDFAGTVTKNDLLAYLAEYQLQQKYSSFKKAELVSLLFEQIEQHGWPENLPQNDYLLKTFEPALRYLLFLYFGHSKGRLNQFSMRDLGIMRTRTDATVVQARFSDINQARIAFGYACDLENLPYTSQTRLCEMAQRPVPELTDPVTIEYGQRFLHKLGVKLLDIDRKAALSVLRCAPGDESKEKWLRECYKDGEKEAVKVQLEQIIDNPASDFLLAFAEDFYARKYHKKRTSKVTDMLRSASTTLQLDISQNQSVEQGVVAWYKRHHQQAWRTENRTWRTLFGLTFWPILFELDTLVTEFDRRPQSLKFNTFYQTFGAHVDALLESLSSAKEWMLHLTKIAAKHHGKVNSVFMWRRNQLDTVQVLLEHAPLQSIKKMLLMMCKDFANLKDGFPDIMVYDGQTLRFEEIKAPGDVLRRNQLIAITQLQEAGFKVQITQVEWFHDPMQPYVVVDIETTGGNNGYHRITEVGMVKMVAGEVTESWQSLFNPQRHIPSNITRLTGISNEMVADAPLFSERAQEIADFTEDCVFVAHNVNFDYGFIRQEFARLEQSFRRPKLCTVVQMRRACPGLSSYSLAALTAHFEISMEQHHRALSDARAAAQLLTIIHDKTLPAAVN